MRAKIAILVLGIIIGLSANFFFGADRRDQKIPERVVYYTASPEESEEETEENKSPVTPEQAQKLEELGFSTKLVPITTNLKNGGKK